MRALHKRGYITREHRTVTTTYANTWGAAKQRGIATSNGNTQISLGTWGCKGMKTLIQPVKHKTNKQTNKKGTVGLTEMSTKSVAKCGGIRLGHNK